MRGVRGLLLIVLFLLSVSFVSAEDQVIINSQNWQDVVLGYVYAGQMGLPVKAITDYDRGIELLDFYDTDAEEVLLIESEEPIIANYQTQLQNRGYTVERLRGDTLFLNIQLYQRSPANGVLLVDDALAYNAVSLGGYAISSDDFLFFIDSDSANRIVNEVRDVDEITLFGPHERAVRDATSVLNPTLINNGDKFSNNLDIFVRHLALTGAQQIVMTDGSVLEEEIFSGNPVLLVGDSQVPDSVMEEIKQQNVQIGIVIGTSLFGNAVSIREETDLKVFVKFGQGQRQQQLPLDTFALPVPLFGLTVNSLEYNIIDRQLVISYQNPFNNFQFFQSEYGIIVNGQTVETIAPEDTLFVPPQSQITQIIDIDLTQYADQDMQANITLLMGEEERTLEAIQRLSANIITSEFSDNSQIAITDVIYNDNVKRFFVTIANDRSDSVYTRVQIEDLLVNEQAQTFSSDVIRINGNQEAQIPIRVTLDPVDIADNPQVSVRAFFGQREEVLAKQTSRTVDLEVESTNYLLIGGIVAGVLIVGLLITIIFLLVNKRSAPKEKPTLQRPTRRRRRRR